MRTSKAQVVALSQWLVLGRIFLKMKNIYKTNFYYNIVL